MKREIPLIITFVAGIAFVISYFIPHWPFNQVEDTFNDWFAIIAAFAIWLGAMNLMKISAIRVARQKENWYLSLIIIVGFLITVAIGFYDGLVGLQSEPQFSFRDPGTHFDWIYRWVFTPLSSTMFAMLAFFVASASYRAFRARNFQATLLLLAGFFVMLGRVPVGSYLTWFLPEAWRMPHWASFIMDFPQTAGQRAIMIGIALGIVSTSLRVILGIERSSLESDS
jgi:hypothetical protein